MIAPTFFAAHLLVALVQAESSPADRFKAVQDELLKARRDWSAGYQKLPEKEQEKYFQEHPYPEAAPYVPRVWAILAENPKDRFAVDALTWLVSESRGTKDLGKALAALERDHVESPELFRVCQLLQYERSEDASRFLRAVAAKNPRRDVQGIANFAVAKQLLGSVSSAKYLAGALEPKALEAYKKAYGEEEVARIQKLDVAKVSAEAEALLDRIAKEYADVFPEKRKVANGQAAVPNRPERSIGDMAKAELHEIRDLAIGKPAPDIIGEDLDGVPFKLSDYRGKVVVLDFWGNW